MKRILSIVLCMAMVVGFFAFGAVAAETKTATLVTDATSLKAGDQVVIVGKNGSDYYALSTNQKSSNRGATAFNLSGNEVTLSAEIQVLTLEAGTKSNTFSFYTGQSGYLYAASSTGNQLKTSTQKNDNSSFIITIDSNDGAATVTAQGTNTRNLLRFNYNNGTPLFACYSSGQTAIYIYKLGDTSGSGSEGGGSVTPPPAPPEADGYTYTKVTTSGGLVDGYYTMVTSIGDAPLGPRWYLDLTDNSRL